MSPSIKVTVIDDAIAGKCEGHCGLEFSSPQVVEQVKEILNKSYGEAIELEYLDLAASTTYGMYPEMVDRVRGEGLPLPLLLVNGNLRVSGYFDTHLLQTVIQAELEMEL